MKNVFHENTKEAIDPKAENNNIQDNKVRDTVYNRDGSVLLINSVKEHNNHLDNNREGIETNEVSSRGFERQGYETSIDNIDLDHALYEENRELREALMR